MIRDIIDIVRRTGAHVQETRATLSEGILIRDRDVVVAAQRAADRYLRRRLLALHRAAWLSPQSADRPHGLYGADTWVVDPLGGGIEFAQWRPQYTIAVALVRSGMPVLSVVHSPATGEVFSATAGAGTWDANGRRLHVTEDGAEFAVDYPDSMAYALAQVAAGRSTLALWHDEIPAPFVCAGALLVTEAGGIVTDVDGGPLRFDHQATQLRGVIAGAQPAVVRANLTLNDTGSARKLRDTRVAPGVRNYV